MNWTKSLTLIIVLTITSNCYAKTPTTKVDGYDVLVDALVLRPMGFIGTVVGSALFIACSPMTAISSIPAPHDAFVKLASTLIVKPAKYTFVRPVGDYDYNEEL